MVQSLQLVVPPNLFDLLRPGHVELRHEIINGKASHDALCLLENPLQRACARVHLQAAPPARRPIEPRHHVDGRRGIQHLGCVLDPGGLVENRVVVHHHDVFCRHLPDQVVSPA